MMNKKLRDALKEQQLKKSLKERIARNKKSNRLLNEEELGFYSTFVKPFTNVFKALKISSQEILSSAMLMVGQVLTLSPKKQKERMENFKNRQQKLEAQWAPIMKDAKEGFKGSGSIAAFAFAPGAFLLGSFGKGAYDATSGVGSYLDDLGLKKGMLSILPGVSTAAVTTTKDADASKKEEKKPLLDKLFTLFLGTAAAAGIGSYLASSKEESPKKENKSHSGNLLKENTADLSGDIKDFLDETGLAEEFLKMQKDLEAHYAGVIKEFDEVYQSKVVALSDLSSSKDLKELVESLSKIDEETGQKEAERIEKSVEESVKKLLGSQSFMDQVNKTTEKELTQEEIEDIANKAVFSDLIVQIQETAKKQLSDIKLELSKDLSELLPDEESLTTIGKSKDGMKLFNMIRDAKSRYNIS